jgi:hypothetical protein
MRISCIQDLCLKRRLTAQKTDGSTNTTIHLNTFCHVQSLNLFRMPSSFAVNSQPPQTAAWDTGQGLEGLSMLDRFNI